MTKKKLFLPYFLLVNWSVPGVDKRRVPRIISHQRIDIPMIMLCQRRVDVSITIRIEA